MTSDHDQPTTSHEGEVDMSVSKTVTGTAKRRGRPVLGAVSGLATGLGLAASLLFNGIVALDSPLLVILPIGGLVLVPALAIWAPLGRSSA